MDRSYGCSDIIDELHMNPNLQEEKSDPDRINRDLIKNLVGLGMGAV